MAKESKPDKMNDKATRTDDGDWGEMSASKIPCNRDVPIYNYFEDHNLDKEWGFAECLDNLLHDIEGGYFLAWEAVARHEQGLPLTRMQQEALGELISFSDDDEDDEGNFDDYDEEEGPEEEPILYIDEIARPNEPWYEIARKIVSRLIVKPLETYKVYDEIYCDGWSRLMECLEEHGHGLSLPEGITTHADVILPEIRHGLWIQQSCEILVGLGQEEELTLENEDQRSWRIERFIEALKECKGSIKYYDLTLEKLFEFVELPKQDEKILTESMMEELGMQSVSEKLYDVL